MLESVRTSQKRYTEQRPSRLNAGGSAKVSPGTEGDDDESKRIGRHAAILKSISADKFRLIPGVSIKI